MFEHRWYLVCEYLDHSQTRVLALERMRRLSIGEKQATSSPHITLRQFYQDCFGIIRDDKRPEETGADYAVFRYYLRPSYDFIQHLLWHREHMEVLRPVALREEVRTLLLKMLEHYGMNDSSS